MLMNEFRLINLAGQPGLDYQRFENPGLDYQRFENTTKI